MNKFILITLSILAVACGNKTSETIYENLEIELEHIDTLSKANIPAKPSEKIEGLYFKANGSEPFWSLLISEKMIKLKTIDDSLFTPHTSPILAADSNVKLYKLQTELTTMNIQVSHTECINMASGLPSPYTVKIDFKKGKAAEFTTLKGCGLYLTDYRLHDIWVLESMSGNTVSKEDFGKELPYIEINSSANTFNGSTGCNRMTGQLFFEYNKLRFTNTAVTKMLCPKSDSEQTFLAALKSATNYSIGNNRLSLKNNSEQLLVFKKID